MTTSWLLVTGIMVVLFIIIILLDYYKNEDSKKFISTYFMGILFLLLGFMLVSDIVILFIEGTMIEIVLQAISLLYMVVIITMIYLLGNQKKEYNRNIFLAILAILFIALIIVVIIVCIQGATYDSLHIGSILGSPALILVSLGTILVIYDENKYVLYHGYSAGSAWILTLINVIVLFTLTPAMMLSYSGLLHAVHIICGGVGLTFGFASALFGISGQRRLAKVSGYTTLACWWTAYLLSIFII
ncbi:MAG: hypothetical protein GY870_08895 [archaeon]|nr:hypothetical protein [archaeon]